ncbi:alpha/beta hydrolase-fold protein [Phenylobacterium sp.]|uniref:alpha/beta hydrolase n=1 Tax=Phenylobacterium sp. TaxID=1871053 RepID=UPI0025F7FF56|nr:alpha/beta hydrolase-fold protein [Phenylobacterium sp.]MCA3721160.1 esterase family protein [Phenylobacterium sp.]
MNRRQHLLALGAGLSGLAAASGAIARSPSLRTAPGLEWVTAAAKGPGVSFHTFGSEARGGPVSFHIYVPPDYAAGPERRFPVVYWLHGSGGGVSGIPGLAAEFDQAIRNRLAPPFLVVFVNGLSMGMYVDWSNGKAPMETIIVHELRSYIDANWRTLATREGRLLDGFSMGGYGAARFGFRYPELFRTVSMMGAGPMQEFLTTAPRASKAQAEELLREVYGGSQAGFQAVSPRRYARENAARLAGRSRLRLVIGDRDETFGNNRDFHAYLNGLGIPHDWIVLPGVGHDPFQVLTALGDRQWAFYRAAFADL